MAAESGRAMNALRRTSAFLMLCASLPCGLGCGTEGAGGADAGGSAGASGGPVAVAGMAGSAGAFSGAGGALGGSGGKATTGGAGGLDPTGSCSPGVSFPAKNVRNCYGYDAAANHVEPGSLSVRQFNLMTPLEANSTYSFSLFASSDPGITLELYGTNGTCGPAGELLFSAPMDQNKVLCAEMHPTQHYDYLLMVWRGEGDAGVDLMMECPKGTCR